MKIGKYVSIIVLAALVAGCEKPTQPEPAAISKILPCEEAIPGGPEDIVRAYYDETIEKKDLEYFDASLIRILERDAECVKREQGICALNFDIRSDSQDPNIRELRICRMDSEKKTVEAQFKNHESPTAIVYQLKSTSNGWRISDVRFPRHANVSLAESLTRTLDTLEKK